MRVYTSYFSNGKRLSAANVVMVGSAREISELHRRSRPCHGPAAVGF